MSFRQLVNTIETNTEINGKSIPVTVTVHAECELEQPDFDYDSDEENEEEMRRFRSGELLNMYLLVEAHALGLSGSDSLGGCFIRSNFFGQDIQDLVHCYDMADTAINNLKLEIKEMAEKLKEYA